MAAAERRDLIRRTDRGVFSVRVQEVCFPTTASTTCRAVSRPRAAIGYLVELT